MDNLEEMDKFLEKYNFLKLKLQYFGHLMRRVDSLEKTRMLGGIAVKPGLLFVGRLFLIIVSISVLVMGLFRFSISSWFSFGRLCFPKNLSISSTLSILLAYNC